MLDSAPAAGQARSVCLRVLCDRPCIAIIAVSSIVHAITRRESRLTGLNIGRAPLFQQRLRACWPLPAFRTQPVCPVGKRAPSARSALGTPALRVPGSGPGTVGHGGLLFPRTRRD